MPDHDFWHERWRTGQIGFHEGRTNRHLERWWGGTTGRVLVPLAGKSADLGWLAARGCEVVGVELSPVACAAFFAERGLVPSRVEEGAFVRWSGGGVTLLQGDVFELDEPFDAAWDRAALIAFSPDERPRYAALVRRLVRGPILLVSFVYDASRRAGPPFPVQDEEVAALYPGAVLLERAAVDEPRWVEVGGASEAVWRTT